MFKFKDCKFYLINLDKHTSRYEKSKKELKKVGIEAERFSAIPITSLEQAEAYKTYPRLEKTKMGQIGCFLSHYKLLEQNINSDKNLCIFEDDIEFCDDFNERMEYIEKNFKFEKWDILFLSSFFHLNNKSFWNNPEYEETGVKHLFKTYSSFCTHSYIINKNSIEKVLKSLDDTQEHTYAIDHAYIQFQKDINNSCYSFVPGCVNQRPEISTINGLMIDQYEVSSKTCGKHIFHKESLNLFNYYSYFFDDLYNNIQFRKRMFNTEVGSYHLNLEEFMFSDYNISSSDSEELPEYKNIGHFASNLPENSICIDIGANYGLSSFPIAIRGRQVVAFEPVNINYYLLNKAIEENNFNDKIKTFKLAIGDNNEKSIIYVPCFRDNCSMAQESAVANMNKTKDFTQEEIQVCTFDYWLETNPTIDQKLIKFIKVDTQGFEQKVVNGMKNFISNNNDFYLLLEWDHNMTLKAGSNLDNLYQTLINFGFVEHGWHHGDKLFYKNKE